MAAGKEQLGQEYEVRWKPFFLDPSLPKDGGLTKVERLNRKFGPERVAQMIPYLTATFASEGLTFSAEGTVGNTFDSHRLLELAGTQSVAKQDALIEQLFTAYFTQGKSLADAGVLLAAAEQAGVDGAAAVIEGGAFADEVRTNVERAYREGVSGVPHFKISSASGGPVHQISGGQPPEAFLSIFGKLSPA